MFDIILGEKNSNVLYWLPRTCRPLKISLSCYRIESNTVRIFDSTLTTTCKPIKPIRFQKRVYVLYYLSLKKKKKWFARREYVLLYEQFDSKPFCDRRINGMMTTYFSDCDIILLCLKRAVLKLFAFPTLVHCKSKNSVENSISFIDFADPIA